MKSEQIKQWTSTTTLADEAVVRSGKSIYKGPIFMISERGINVGTGFGVYFFKWEHVLTIDKYKKKKETKALYHTVL